MRLIQVAQHAEDLDRAAGFYERLLGVAPTARFDPPGLVFFDLGGVRLLLETGAATAMLYLGVDDVDAAIARSGAEVVSEPNVIFSHADDTLGPAGMDEVQAFIRDSEGNTVGLVAFRPPA